MPAMEEGRGGVLGYTLIVLATAVALLSGCATGRFREPTREQVLQRILPSSVQVIIEQDGRRFRTGSGVVIAARPTPQGSHCFVLTSGHTLARLSKQAEVYVVFGRHQGAGKKARATVVAQRETDDMDLSLLRLDQGQCRPARAGDPPALGEPIWVVAFPWGRNMTLVGGVVSQVNEAASAEGEPASRLMVDASVSYGASGGGVYEAGSGALVGLVEGYRTARVSFKRDAPRVDPARADAAGPAPAYIDVPVPGETYVTPLADIRRFLRETGYGALLGDRGGSLVNAKE